MDQISRKPGRPRKNLEGKGDGNPPLQIRFDRSDLERIKAMGGAAWARPILLKALKESQEAAISCERLSKLCMLERMAEAIADRCGWSLTAGTWRESQHPRAKHFYLLAKDAYKVAFGK